MLIIFQFFAREAGCYDPDCPFNHDDVKPRARRAEILEARRKYMSKASPKHVAQYNRMLISEYRAEHNLGMDDPLPRDLQRGFFKSPAKQFCARPECGLPWMKGDKSRPLQKCARCKWTYYCSVRGFLACLVIYTN